MDFGAILLIILACYGCISLLDNISQKIKEKRKKDDGLY